MPIRIRVRWCWGGERIPKTRWAAAGEGGASLPGGTGWAVLSVASFRGHNLWKDGSLFLLSQGCCSSADLDNLQEGRFRQEMQRDGGECLLQDLKLPGTLILVVQRIHGVVGEFPGACGVLEFQTVHGAVGTIALA